MQSELQSDQLTEQQAADYLGMSKRMLWSLRKRGDVPHIRIGRWIRYRRCDLDAFLAGCVQGG